MAFNPEPNNPKQYPEQHQKHTKTKGRGIIQIK